MRRIMLIFPLNFHYSHVLFDCLCNFAIFFSFTIVIKCACLFHKCLGQYQECLGVFLHQRFSSTLVVSRDGPIGIPSSHYTCNGCWYWLLLLLGTAQTSHSLRLQGMRGFFGPSKCPVVMQLLFSWDLHQAWPVMLNTMYISLRYQLKWQRHWSDFAFIRQNSPIYNECQTQ